MIVPFENHSSAVMCLFRHVLERFCEMLLAEWKLTDSPDFGVLNRHIALAGEAKRKLSCHQDIRGSYRLQGLLDLHIKGSGLQGDDLRGSVWVVGNRGTALRTEKSVNCFARRSFSCVTLDGSIDCQLVLRYYCDESCETRVILAHGLL